MSYNDYHSTELDNFDNRPKGKGRVTRDIGDFNNGNLTTVGAIAKVTRIYRARKRTKTKQRV